MQQHALDDEENETGNGQDQDRKIADRFGPGRRRVEHGLAICQEYRTSHRERPLLRQVPGPFAGRLRSSRTAPSGSAYAAPKVTAAMLISTIPSPILIGGNRK